jgi:hypothetical protein
MAYLRRIALALATGYIFFFYSERMFWSFLRPDDNLFFQILGWLLYSLFTYMTLAIITYFRVRTMWALFLAGAAFGWIVEGIYAMTFFGGGLPLPFSIVWTGVAWHALISVVIGWYLLQVSVARRGYLHTLSFSSLLGLFWGVWAAAWILETPPIVTTSAGFLLHAFGTIALLIGALWVTPRLRPGSFAPSRGEYWALLTVAILFTLFVTIPTVLFAAAVLLAAFALVFYVLARNREKEGSKPALNILAVFDAPAPLGKYLCIFAMPIVASTVYIGLNAAELAFRSNLIALVITSALGTVFFATSVYKVLKKG